MSKFASCLYFGEVVHQRFSPRRHRLRYHVFQGFFDLDELPILGRKLRLFSHNRANVFAFHDSDHGNGDSGALRAYVENLLKQGGVPADGGRIALLCVPRILGFVFNPLSIFYCYTCRGELIAIIYEVNNTFGQRHSYMIPIEGADSGAIRQTCKKEFYVSPFLDIDMTYNFKLSQPNDKLIVSISGSPTVGTPLIVALFTGSRRELSDISLVKALLLYPFLSLGVVFAIHWEAVKLFAKGLRLRRRPPPPSATVTIVKPPCAGPMESRQAEALDDHLHKMDKQSA